MACFIGIQIPAELRSEITNFCRARQYIATEPHIKLISPHLLENTPIVQQKLESFCLSQSDFKVIVAGPNCYNNQMLYLTVLPGVINIMRDRLAKHLKVLPGKVYRPHLTIMRQHAGRSIDLERYLEEARQTFTKPFSFDVSQATLYVQRSEKEPFLPSLSAPFTGR